MLGDADLDRLDAERVEHLTMLAERSLERENAGLHDLEVPGRVPRLPAPLRQLYLELVDLVAAHGPAEAA